MILSGDSMHPKRPRPSVSVWNNSKGPSQFPRPEWDLLRLLLQLHHDLPSPFVILLSLKVKVTQSCLILCNPMNCSPSGSSAHEILQARILEWVAIPPPRDLPDPGIEPYLLCLLHSSSLHPGFFITKPPGKPLMKYQSPVIRNNAKW